MRKEYLQSELLESKVASDPFDQFSLWYQDAKEAIKIEPNAMVLATANKAGVPSARAVLLKGFDRLGFIFFTNYNSRKATEILENPVAALLFYWSELERQIRIEGSIEKVSRNESIDYFESRPKGSQIGAVCSPQSTVVSGRDELENHYAQLAQSYSEKEIPCPEHWGGFRLKPQNYEFWQGRENRLHDRIRYRNNHDKGWIVERLAP